MVCVVGFLLFLGLLKLLALGIGLIADAAGMITAIVLGLMFYGG